jgi:hypothetical protein
MCSVRRTDLKIPRRQSALGTARLFGLGARLILTVTLLAAALGDGVDAPRRHLCAKVTVSNCHLKEASMEHG